MATKKKAAYTESHKGSTKSSSASKSKSSSSSSHKGHQKTIKEIMSPRVVAVTSITFLPEAAQIMLEEDVGALPVVQEDGTLLGIVTDRDITVRGVAKGQNTSQVQVADIFTTDDLVTVSPETTIAEAERLMEEHQVRRLPIVEGGTRLVGIVALADIARAVGKSTVGEVLKEVSKPGGEHDQATES